MNVSADQAGPARAARQRLVVRCSLGLVATGISGALAASIFGGCAQQPITVPTRSLERSGRSSFVCLAQPRTEDPNFPGRGEARPITDCTLQRVLEVTNYLSDPDAGTDTSAQCGDGGPSSTIAGSSRLPHLYALVTQTTRGEVAVIDMTATNNPVLDEDPSVPGANFLPVGAQPIDIVSTPGGIASFVGVAEVGREGIFALPSSKLRPQNADPCSGSVEVPAPQISSWPACRLPSAPGQMLLVNDPTMDNDGKPRSACPGATPTNVSSEHPNGDLTLEGEGRPKLVVAMPALGGIIVIDAQQLLDQLPGSFGPCPVERWVPLDATVPDVAPPPPFDPLPGHACVSPAPVGPKYARPYTSQPSSITYASGRLYVGDLSAPLIHVIDMPTPCDPVERLPLMPTSVTDPKRVVTTTKVAVASALTPDLKRYLYAVDTEEGSAMVFDVSDDQASRFPTQRAHADWDPLDPPDRIRFAAPIADLLVAERDVPATHPATGVAPHGTRCDPDPNLTACEPLSQSCDAATLYRTSAAYEAGAGPQKLRGEFAFFALSSGKVAVIDIDDYDALCRAPQVYAGLYGCPPPGSKKDPEDTTDLTTTSSRELSCNIVIPNTPRMSTYETINTVPTGARAPGLQIFPLLYDDTGMLRSTEDAATPLMVATVPNGASNLNLCDMNGVCGFSLDVGLTPANIDASGSIIASGLKNALVMNFEDPHAQLGDQNWTVTYEGALPGFQQETGGLKFTTDSSAILDDADGRFCAAGVMSEKAEREELAARGLAATTIEALGPALADYVQIADGLAVQDDPYWQGASDCSYSSCLLAFGDVDAPQPGRDFRVTEGFEDRLELTSRSPSAFAMAKDAKGDPATIKSLTKCCFPTLVHFNIRAGAQWVVQGDQSGFLHRVIADPTTGVCRTTCDPRLVRQNGRAPEFPLLPCNQDGDCGGAKSGLVCADKAKVCVVGCRGQGGNTCPDTPAHSCSSTTAAVGSCKPAVTFQVRDGDPNAAFINPMFRFAVIDGLVNGEPVRPKRDMQFRFATTGSFISFVLDLSAGVANAENPGAAASTAAPLIQPAGISLVPATSELAVTDGTINGLIIVNLSSPGVSKVFF